MATTVGLVHLDFSVVGAQSLKDKRQSVKSFKDRMTHRHNVSVAEVDAQDNRNRAVLAVAIVGSDRRYMEGVLQLIINAAENHRDMVLLDAETEWL